MNTQESSQLVSRLLAPVTECLTPDVASALVHLRAQPDVQAHIDDLAERCNEGRLTPFEQAEYRDIVEAIDFISILQAKARARLARVAEA
jgi:hypothetical protein